MIVDSTTIGLIGAGSIAAGLGTTFAVQKKFGISVRNVNQKSLKQRSEEMQERFKFGQPFQGSALFGAMSREQEERQRESLMRSGLKISALMFWASKIICVAVGIIVGILIGTKLTGLATVAAAAPRGPASRYPTKVAVFTAIGPGVLSLTAKMSKMSLSSIQCSRWAISRRIRGIMA